MVIHSLVLYSSLIPRLNREPGINCLCMRVISSRSGEIGYLPHSIRSRVRHSLVLRHQVMMADYSELNPEALEYALRLRGNSTGSEGH